MSLPGVFKVQKSVQLEQVSNGIVGDKSKEVTGPHHGVAHGPLHSLLAFTSKQDGQHQRVLCRLRFHENRSCSPVDDEPQEWKERNQETI